MAAFRAPLSTRPSDPPLRLSADAYRMIADWHHFAILSLLNTRGFRPDPAVIGARLGIGTKAASQAIERLERLGLLEVTRQRTGRVTSMRRTARRFTTTDDIRNDSLRGAHSSNLELARRSLERDAVEERDFSAMTLAFDHETMPKAKELIRRFQDELADLVETSRADEVYKLCVQLFPLTRKDDR